MSFNRFDYMCHIYDYILSPSMSFRGYSLQFGADVMRWGSACVVTRPCPIGNWTRQRLLGTKRKKETNKRRNTERNKRNKERKNSWYEAECFVLLVFVFMDVLVFLNLFWMFLRLNSPRKASFETTWHRQLHSFNVVNVFAKDSQKIAKT